MSQTNWNDFTPVDGSGVSQKPAPQVGPVNWDDFTPAPEEPGLVARVKQGASRAINSARTALTDDPNKIAQIASDQARTALPQTETQRKMAEEIAPYVDAANKAQGVVDNVKTWGAAGVKRAGQLLSNPGEAGKMIAEQLPNALPGMAGGIAGAKLGAMAGSAVAPGIGTLVGGVLGGVAGGFAGGYGLEKGAAMQEQVQKEARAQQIDLQDQPAVAKMVALKQAEFDDAAQLKGLGTAGTDALLNVATMGLAGVGGRTLAKEARSLADAVKAGTISAADAGTTLARLEAADAARNTLSARALRGSGVVGAEMAGEGLSEAAGQKLAYGKVDAGDVIDEALLGLGTGGAMALGSKAFNKAAGIVDQDGTTRDIAAARDGLGELGPAFTTEPGAADPNAPQAPIAEAPEAPDLTTTLGAGVPRDGLPFTRDVDTSGLAVEDRGALERARAAMVDYEPGDTTPQWDTQPGAAGVRGGLNMPAPEFDTGTLGLESRGRALTASERMGINPAAGPLSRVAAVAVDSGASPVQFLGATGRDLQARATGPGVTNESNVIDVQGRVIEDRAIATPRRLADDRGMATEAVGGPGNPPAAPAATPALPAPRNLRELQARVRAQKQEAANAQAAAQRATPAAQALPGPGAVESDSTRTAGIANDFPTAQGSTNGPQADQAVQAIPQPAQAGPAPATEPAASVTPQAPAGAPEVRALTDGAPAQNLGAQAAPAPGPQGQAAAPQTAVARPDGWRKSMLKAAPVAKAMGIDPKGKRLSQVVAEIDARDTQAPPAPAPTPAPGPVRIGRDQTPLADGGRPFKTRKAAGDAKKLQPMMRVVQVEGGFALADKTPAQLAAEERAAKRLRTARTSPKGEPVPAHAFIAAGGGLHMRHRNDLGVDGNPRVGNRRLFGGLNKGLSIEQATEMLVADGYLSEGASHNDAYALIKKSLSQPQYNADGIERIAESDSTAMFEDYMAAQEEAMADGDVDPFDMADEFTTEELDEVGFSTADPQLQAEVSALIAQADAMEIDTYAILEDIARTYADATQDQYNAAARDALAAAIARGNQDGGSAAAQAAPAPEPATKQGLNQPEAPANQAQAATENAAPEALELTALSPVEAAAQQSAQEQATKAEAAAKRAEEAAAKAEEERKRIAQASVRAADSFELGQDPMDSLTGQGGLAFSFAGARAATADTHALVTAQDRLDAGEDPEAVRRETGWHRGADGRMRFEINDRDAAMKIGRKAIPLKSFARDLSRELDRPLRLGDVLDHPALFAAYPALTGYGVTFVPAEAMPDGARGTYSSGRIMLADDLTSREALSTLLHEIQHGIQNIEGFATGDSPERLARTMPDANAMNDAKLLARFMATQGDTAFDARQRFMRYMGRDPNPQGVYLAERYEPEEIARMAASPLDGYRRSAGEVEARNTQARQGMTDTQRRATPPNQTADVADSDVIVVFNGEEMESAPEPANAERRLADAKQRLGAPLDKIRADSDERLVATQMLVDGLVQNWTRAPEIIVARNMQDRAIPQAVRDYDQTLKSQGATGEPRGFIYKGKVYLLADELRGPQQIAEVLFHEALGHFGLRGAFGDGLKPILQQMGTMRRRDVVEKAREYGMVSKGMSDADTWAAMSVQDRLSAAEEVLAEMAQSTPEIGFVQRAIASIRTWLRANVPGFKDLVLTDAEIIRSYLIPARGFVTRSSETPQQSLERAMMAFSRGAGRFTSISVPRGTVSWLGFDGAVSLRADLQALANRHPEYYGSAADVERDIAFVMEKPDNWYIHDGGKVMLFREGTGNQIPQVRVELERSGADFVVRSVYVGDRRQIAKKMADKRKMLGGIGLGGQSLDSLSVADYLSAVGNRSSRPEPLPSSSPDTPVDGKAGEGDGQPVRFSRAQAAAATPATGWDAPVKTGFDDVIYKLQDKNIDLKRVVEAIAKSAGQVADSIDAYMKEELFHKRAAKRVADFGTQELRPLMNQMRMAGLSMDDVQEYLHARHAKEANAVIASRNPDSPGLQDGGSGMTNAAADNYFAKLDPAQRKKLEAVSKKVDGIIEGTRKLYVSYGLEDQAVVDGWAGMYQHYIPLMREDKDGGMGTGQGFSVKGKETKGRTGSTRKVVDILANIATQREKLIVRGEKNQVTQALVGLAQANPNPEFWEVRSQAPTERVFDPKKGVVVDRPDPLFKSRDNVIVAKVLDSKGNVTEQMVVFNEDNPRAMRMAAAMKNLDAGDLEGLLGVSAKITRYFAAINTQYNPVFGVVNLVRDVQGAMINLAATPLAGQQGKIARDTASALIGIYSDIRKTRRGGAATSKWAQLWEQMQDDGGTTGYRELFTNSTDRANDLKSILNPEGWMDNKWGKVFTANGALRVPMSMAQKGATEIFGWLSDYNEAMENGVRLAAYKAALDMGMSRERAASLAKNLTVNFNRKGQVGQQAGAVYAFFNAAMQGTARLGQTLFDMDGGDFFTLRLSKTGKAVVYGGVLLGVMQALALAGAGFDDEDPPEFVRERSLIIPTGNKTYISIPMPLGLHVIPGLGRQATEFALSGFDKPAKRALSVVGMFADAFNPIGNAGLSMQTLAPTALDPLVALTENKDWTGKPIARVSSNKALPGHTQWKDTATGFSKMVAEAINWVSGGNEYVAGALSPTPDQIDYLLAQVGGGVARELSKVSQTASTVVSGEELPTYKIPLLGRFAGNAASQASQGTAFYANLDKLNALETEIKGLRKDGRFMEAAQLARENPESGLIALANRAERDVQKLRRDKRELIATGATRDEVRAKEAQITAVMVRLNEAAERRKAAATG